MKLTLPWPPSINNYWKQRVITSKGRAMATTYVSEEGNAFRKSVVETVFESLGQHKPKAGRLSVSIELHQPDRRARDIDNIVKPLLDALTAAKVWNDDSQVDQLRVIRCEVCKANPRTEVTIEVLKEADKTLFDTEE